MSTNETGKSSEGAPTSPHARRHEGGCHCGAVRFAVTVDAGNGSRCNCSVCQKTSPLGAVVKPDAFELLAGEDKASVYEWRSKTSKRYFCSVCGVHCFGKGHLAELGGDFVSVNLNCLDDVDPLDVTVIYWDGRHDNWQAGPRETPWPVRTSA